MSRGEEEKGEKALHGNTSERHVGRRPIAAPEHTDAVLEREVWLEPYLFLTGPISRSAHSSARAIISAARVAIAMIVSCGFTPRELGITEPSTTNTP